MTRALLALTLLSAASAQELRTAAGHSMQYYVSLPTGWTAARKWPLVVIIEAAERQFRNTLDVFVKARGDTPFLLVAPLVTTDGGANYRQADTYRYSEAVWAEIERDRCGFDLTGIAAVVRDVQRLYSAEERYFLTGWEAGGHTVWPLIFQHPEALRAAAPAVTNWAGRCMEAGFSNSPARAELPVAIFQLAGGRDVAPGRFVVQQSLEARKVAVAHGYRRISERIVSNRPHGPLADEVLAWFQSLL